MVICWIWYFRFALLGLGLLVERWEYFVRVFSYVCGVKHFDWKLCFGGVLWLMCCCVELLAFYDVYGFGGFVGLDAGFCCVYNCLAWCRDW